MTSTSTPTTRATARKAQLDHLLDNILEAQGNNDHVIRLIAKAQGVVSVSDFINISETDLQNMSLHDSNGDDVPIPGTITNKILNLSEFFIHYIDKRTHDWTAHNEFDLETFMLTGTGPLTPTNPGSGPPVSPVAPTIDTATIQAIPAAVGGATTSAISHAPKTADPLDTFLKNKGTSKAYKPFCEVKYWNQWHHAFVAIATSQGLEDVLNPMYSLGCRFWGLPPLIPLLQCVNRLGFEICSANSC